MVPEMPWQIGSPGPGGAAGPTGGREGGEEGQMYSYASCCSTAICGRQILTPGRRTFVSLKPVSGGQSIRRARKLVFRVASRGGRRLHSRRGDGREAAPSEMNIYVMITSRRSILGHTRRPMMLDVRHCMNRRTMSATNRTDSMSGMRTGIRPSLSYPLRQSPFSPRTPGGSAIDWQFDADRRLWHRDSASASRMRALPAPGILHVRGGGSAASTETVCRTKGYPRAPEQPRRRYRSIVPSVGWRHIAAFCVDHDGLFVRMPRSPEFRNTGR